MARATGSRTEREKDVRDGGTSAAVCDVPGGCVFRRNGGACTDGIRMFEGLPVDARDQLLEDAVHSSHSQGSILVHRGDAIDSILILRSGRIKTFTLDQDGEECVLDVLHEGQAIWHGMFLTDGVYHYSVACITPVELCRIRLSDYEAFLKNRPDLAMQLIRVLCTELDAAEEKLMTANIRDPRRRLAQFLLLRDERCAGSEIHMKLNDIAGSVSLRPETVSRVIAEFARRGLIERLGRGRLRVVDREALRELAGVGE
jgi:CRP-like cAMP-binding protein